MNNLKTVGVKDLKNNLSAYLREVKQGIKIFVTEHNSIIAELHEPFSNPILPDSKNSILTEWVNNKIIIMPQDKKTKICKSNIKLKKGVALALLNEDREE
jgi:hypothetical protein